MTGPLVVGVEGSAAAQTFLPYQASSFPSVKNVQSRMTNVSRPSQQPRMMNRPNVPQYLPQNASRSYQPLTQNTSQQTSGIRAAAMGYSLAAGLFPMPFNPLFIPLQATVFIVLIIILLFKGYSFWTAALLAWLVPGLIAAVIHYAFLSTAMSVIGYGE